MPLAWRGFEQTGLVQDRNFTSIPIVGIGVGGSCAGRVCRPTASLPSPNFTLFTRKPLWHSAKPRSLELFATHYFNTALFSTLWGRAQRFILALCFFCRATCTVTRLLSVECQSSASVNLYFS